MSDQIQGLPDGAIVGPAFQAPVTPTTQHIEGLPDGAVVGPSYSTVSAQFDKTPQYVKDMAANNPNSYGSGRFNAYAQLGEGVIKGAKETARGVTSLWNKAADTVADTVGVQRDKPIPVPFQNEDLEGKTPLETAGKAGESILEFVSGDEALKGASLAEKFGAAQKIAKLAETSPKIAR